MSARLGRESFAADPSDLSGRLAMAQSFFSMGNVDEGIRVLEEARAQSSSAANVSFMPGQALLNRGAPQDVSRAFEVFQYGKHREVGGRTGGSDHNRSDQSLGARRALPGGFELRRSTRSRGLADVGRRDQCFRVHQTETARR